MARNPEQSGGGEVIPNRQPEEPERYTAPKKQEGLSHSPENKKYETDKARSEAVEQAVEKQSYDERQEPETARQEPHTSSRASRSQGFTKTMDRVRKDLTAPQRVFSKIIHSPVIEKTSDIVGSTVARPDAILSGSVSAFIFTTALYFIARYFGFSLSGSETIAAFAIGWLVGLLFDLLKKMFRARL